MKRNVAGQVVGAQMVSAADGSAFTGSVTVHVTGDAGTQAPGSVGSGACTHEGNGFHTYAPAQAETNYGHVAFTFVGTDAVPAVVQIYTSFPQTGDAYAAAVTIDGIVDDILADTATLPSDPADQSLIIAATDAIVAAIAAVQAVVDAIVLDTGTDGVVVASASKTGYTLGATGSAALTESYAAAGATATLPQLLYALLSLLSNFAIVDTTLTFKKLNGTAAGTATLDDATDPTSLTRAT